MHHPLGLALLVLGALALGSCHPAPVARPPSSDWRPKVAVGDRRLELPVGDPARVQAELELAMQSYTAAPRDEGNIVWLGRRLAYQGRLDEAMDVYSEGLRIHPTSHRLLRHRGHRWISLRDFDRAIEDLEQAARWCEGLPDHVELDGMPNAYGRPRSTTQGNIWYHLGLGYWLRGEFEEAAACYRRCLELSTNDDTFVAVAHWHFMTLRRLGLDTEAATLLRDVREDMEILENHAYHELLLMYRDERRPVELLRSAADAGAVQNATVAFGVAHWWLLLGERARAAQLLQRIVDAPPSNAFGRIAAEVELARGPSP